MKKSDFSPVSAASAEGAPSQPLVSAVALRALLDQCFDGICLVDPAGWSILYANAVLLNWVSPSAGPSPDSKLVDWLPEREAAPVLDRLASVATGESDVASFSGCIVDQSGVETAAEFTASRVDADGRTVLAIVVRKASFVTAPHGRARTDPLTGLADRAFLMERLTSLVEGERSRDHQCAVLFVDVDGFKQVNDAYGHLVGDRVLCEVAQRLAGCVRSDDHVARFGGDEFVVLLENVCSQHEIQPVVDRIGSAFTRPVELPQGSVALAVSVGVAVAEPPGPRGQTADELLDAADRAMYAAKRTAT